MKRDDKTNRVCDVTGKYSPEEVRLRAAAADIVRHNRRLRDALAAADLVTAVRGGITRLLDCETNGAHAYLERFADALKSFPRGAVPPIPMTLVRTTSEELLLDLSDALRRTSPPTTNHPSPTTLSLNCRRSCRHAFDAAATLERRLDHFITGVSGADANITEKEYCRRIDHFIRDLKKSFDAVRDALVDVEEELSTSTTSPTPTTIHQTLTTPSPTPTTSHQTPTTKRPRPRTRYAIPIDAAAAAMGISSRQLKRMLSGESIPPPGFPGLDDPRRFWLWAENRARTQILHEGVIERARKRVRKNND